MLEEIAESDVHFFLRILAGRVVVPSAVGLGTATARALFASLLLAAIVVAGSLGTGFALFTRLAALALFAGLTLLTGFASHRLFTGGTK